MRYLSMFSGIEAATVAWHPLGWQAAAFCEIEAFPSAVLRHHYPETPNLGDVTKADFDSIGDIDLAVFGSPCQSFSVAGKRLGLDDPRGNLALLAGSIVYRKRPRWFVFENVPGLLSSDSGWDFGTLLAAFAGHPSGSVFAPPAEGWGTAGVVPPANPDSYGIAWRVLDAQYFGVAQRRRRVFAVGYLGDWRRAAAVLFERHGLSGHPAPRREAREDTSVSPSLRARANSSHRADSQAFIPDVGYALNAHGGAHGRQDAESETLIATTLRARDIAKGVDSDRTDTLIAHSLRGEGFDASEDGTGRGTPLVPVEPYVLMERGRDGSPNLEYRQDGTANAILTPNGGRGGLGVGAVAFAQNTRDEVREMPYVGALAADPGMKQTSYVRTASAVRRLTPRECERLQGFEDDYTMIAWRGKPAADCPDGPRYKAIGNSMAVPCMAWIGRRIAAVEALQINQAAA